VTSQAVDTWKGVVPMVTEHQPPSLAGGAKVHFEQAAPAATHTLLPGAAPPPPEAAPAAAVSPAAALSPPAAVSPPAALSPPAAVSPPVTESPPAPEPKTAASAAPASLEKRIPAWLEKRPSARHSKSDQAKLLSVSASGRITGAFGSEAQRQEHLWCELGGEALEPSLRSGAIALMRAEWLVQYAKGEGAVLSRRQDLPDEAFISLDELMAAIEPQDSGLRVIVLSYGWTTPLHPDPLGATLLRVADVLQHYVGTHAVFWDFCSLMQHSPSPGGPRRTPAEEATFGEGLVASGLLYAHRATIVFRLTTWPAGYPEQYDLSGGANEAEYEDRGWCFSEMCTSALTKPALNSLDLGKFSGTRLRLHGSNGIIAECTQGVRRPPLLPEQFLSELGGKTFYNPASDMPLVSSLYSRVFGEQMGAARELDFKRMGWGCAEAIQLARVVGSGALPNLHRLNLSWNDVADKGAKKLAEALSEALPPLEKLLYKGNPMGEGGAALLRAAYKACREKHKEWSVERQNEAASEVQAIHRGHLTRLALTRMKTELAFALEGEKRSKNSVVGKFFPRQQS